MKALSLTQPWATLCMLPARSLVGKHYETRGWATRYRGPLVIHAAKGFPGSARAQCAIEPFRSALAAAGYWGYDVDNLPLGALLGTVTMVECWLVVGQRLWTIELGSRPLPLEPERSFGDYSPGRYVFEFSHQREFPQPIPYRGALGLFDVPDSILPEGMAQ